MEVKVTNPLLSFSSNFVEDETWALVKEMLMMVRTHFIQFFGSVFSVYINAISDIVKQMFSPVQEDERAASDLYVFTKSRDSVYFRIFKVFN